MADDKQSKRPYRRKKKDPYEGMAVVKTEKKVHGNTGKRKLDPKTGQLATTYKPSYPALAKKLMEAGSTQFEVAQYLGITEPTLYHWCAKYPEFKMALKAGAEICDNRVEMTLYQKATGYKWVEEVKSKTINDEGEEVEEVTQVTKTLPPDTSSMIFWLKNRRSNKWKDKHEMTVNQNINIVTSNDLQQLLSQSIMEGEFTLIEDKSSTT